MRLIFLSLLGLFLHGCGPLELRGTVIDYNRKPISGAQVINKRSGQSIAKTSSDSTGRFILEGLRLEDSIIVIAPGYQAETAVFDYLMTKRPELTVWLKASE